MNKNKELRKLNVLLYNKPMPWMVIHGHENFIKFKEDTRKRVNDALSLKKSYHPASYINQCKEFAMIFDIAERNGISDEELQHIWYLVVKDREDKKKLYQATPTPEGRDNKGVYVGGGGSNGQKIRIPSKKRNKRTWKIFYSMFPSQKPKEDEKRI